MSRGCRPMVARLPLALVAAVILAFASTQGMASEVKTWTQTSVKDFSRGTLEDVVVTNTSGGELKLPHPMKKVVADHKDNTIPRFASFDREGNYLYVWRDGNLFAQRYKADGTPLTDGFQVNEVNGGVFPDFSSALGKAGFLVVWKHRIENRPGVAGDLYGQLYDSNGAPLGRNFYVATEPIGLDAFADTDDNYWILWGEGSFFEGADIYAQQYTNVGEKLGQKLKITDEITDVQFHPSVSTDREGNFVVAYVGGGFYQNLNVFARRFNRHGEALGPAFKVSDRDVPRELDVCSDGMGNFLIAWTEIEDEGSDIFAQFYDSDGTACGTNFKVNAGSGYHSAPDVSLSEDKNLQISWLFWNGSGDDTYASEWSFVSTMTGIFTSSVLDTGPTGTSYEKISWNAETVPGVSSVRFKIRTSSDLETINKTDWCGPNQEVEYYTTASGQNVNTTHNGDRYIQYRAFLSTTNGACTSILKDITISFTTADLIAPQVPSNFKAVAGYLKITVEWNANTEADLLGYRLYRGDESGVYDSTWTRLVPKGGTVFVDTLVEAWTTYYYAISAMDSSLNESRLSREVSATPYGHTWYVSAENLGAGDGSMHNPFPHISDALQVTSYGDRVYVAPGVYEKNIVVNSGVALLGEDPRACKIIGAVKMEDNSVISGFTVQHTIDCSADSAIVSDNIIIGTGPGEVSGNIAVGFRGGSPVISGNIITDAWIGIGCENPGYVGASLTRAKIFNNIITRTTYGIDISDMGSCIEIYNNTIYLEATDMPAINLAYGHHIEIMNNIIVNKQATGIWASWGSHVESISYNDVITGSKEGRYVGCKPGEENISIDPMFVNPDKGDFRLNSNSPCRDAGNPNLAWDDVDGTRNDMGAYGGPTPMRLNLYHPSVAIKMPPVSASPGDTIVVPVEVDNPTGVAKVSMEVVYDPDLLAALDIKSSGFSMIHREDSDGTLRFSLRRGLEIFPTTEDTIAEVVFVVSPAAHANDACSLHLRKIVLRDELGSAVEVRSITDGVFVVIEKSSSERVIYVDQSYSGKGDGSWSKPFSTINEGLAAASEGDTVQVAAGVYHERIIMKSGVTLKGSGPLTTRIEVETNFLIPLPEESSVVVFNNVSNCALIGLEIQAQRGVGPPSEVPAIFCFSSSPLIKNNRIVYSGERAAVLCDSGSKPRIEGNLITASEEMIYGIFIKCNSSDPTIIGNRFEIKTVGDFGVGISCTSSNPIILDNHFLLGGGTDVGISCETSNPVIANNLFSGIGKGSNVSTAITIKFSSPTIVNNITQGCATGIIIADWEPTNSAVIKNNIIVKSKNDVGNGKGVVCPHGAPVQLSYNLFWDNDMDYFSCSAGEGNLNADPMFVDPEAKDFRLKPHSPGIDAGDPDPKYNDLDGSRNDMGIYGGPYAELSDAMFPLPIILSLPDTSASPGDTLSLPISAVNASGIAEVKIVLSYSPQTLSVFDVQTTAQSRTFSLTTENLGNGQTQILMSSTSGIKASSCPLTYVTVAINNSAETGSQSSIEFGDVALRDELAGDVLVSKKLSGLIKIETPTAVKTDDDSHSVPSILALLPNYPNPFNSLTVIPFIVPSSSPKVKLTIYNPLGQKIRTLVDGEVQSGEHRVIWDSKDDLGRDVSSGVYFYQLTVDVGKWTETKKMLLLR